jgi:hypothetical protein
MKMKKVTKFMIWAIILSLLSCKGGTGSVTMTKEGIIENVKETFVNDLDNPKISTDNSGNIFISSGETYYTINPDEIIFGQIDDDNFDDALVHISVSTGGNLEIHEYLPYYTAGEEIVEFNHDPMVIIKKIENGVIYGDIPEYAEDDPRCCPSIHHEVKYQLIGKKIVEIQ